MASNASQPNKKTTGRPAAKKRRMTRKGFGITVLMLGLVFVLIAIFLAACMKPGSSSNPLESSDAESSLEEVLQSTESSEPERNPDVIQIIDPDEISAAQSEDPASAESKTPDPAETSKPKDTSSEVSYDQPSFQGGDVVTPVSPSSEYIDIREVTTPDRNKLVVVGVDTEDPKVAEGIQKIQDIYASYKKTTGFFAYSLDGKRAVAYNCENEFFSACTVKTGFILYCCLAIDQGLADKDDVMYYEEKFYHGGSGYIKYGDYGASFTIERLIYLCLNVSDNIAYEMLTAYFGHDGYNKMMADLGCERLQLDRSIWSYRMNAHDLAILWREVYFYFQTDSYMARLFKEATFNTRYNYATKYVKCDYNHKSGDSQASRPVINDGAIVWAEHPYVVAILNSSMGDREDDVAVANTVKYIHEYIIDGPTVSDKQGTD